MLYNPIAGGNSGKEGAGKLTELLKDKELVFTDMTGIGSYGEFFAGLQADDEVILCGGDGTLNRFINETANLKLNHNILYYGIGSGNDFLRDLGKEKGCEPFCINQYMENLPTVTVKGKTYRFLNGVGFGIDGYCCQEGDRQREAGKKKIDYTSIAIKGLLFHHRPHNAKVTVDGVTTTYKNVWIAPTMNGVYYGGGMMPTPNQKRNNPEGLLSLLVFHTSGKIKTLMIFPSLFKGEHIKKEKYTKVLTGHDITVEFDRPCALQIDGETILDVTEYRAQCKVPAKV